VVLLAHVDAERPRAVQEDLVELRPLDLEGVAEGVVRPLAEAEGPGLRIGAPAEGAAVLARETLALELVEDPEQPADPVHGRGEERLADLVAREGLAFEEQHPGAAHRQEGDEGRARGAAA
jgi:hypothetical protein